MKRWHLTTTLAAALAVAFTMHALAAKPDAAKVGAAAPAFTLKDQSGKDVSLSDFSGKIVVLEWFNDGCPFVQKHYKTGNMNSVASKYAGKDVVWLAVNSTKSASQSHNAKVAGEWKMERPILDDSAGKVGHAYGATNTPNMFIIDKDGKLVYRGAIDSDTSDDAAATKTATNYVAKALDELLAGKTVSQPETKPYGCSVKYAD
jgi:peroxiredoxin